jgi:hypothetical protein
MDDDSGLIDVGRFRAASCAGQSRRSFLRLGATLPLLGGLTQSALGAPTGRAKSVLFVWLWGAPSHVDLCDPKPDAPIEFRGPFAPIATRTPGMQFSEILPRLAARSDRFSVIRSHVTSEPGHPDAGTVGMTGFKERPEPVQPSFGAIVGKHRGHRGSLPPYVMVGQGIPRDVVRIVEGYGGGKFGKAWDPFQISCSDAGEVNIPSLHLIDGITPNRITDRRTLLNQVDSSVRRFEVASQADWNRVYQRAVNLLTTSEARQAFDLTAEQTKTRQAYGHTSFGQSCLLARRLVEAEVPFVQVNWSQYVESITPNCDFGWDTHIYNFELLQDTHGPIFDRAFSALLDDLDDRGLLDSTLVVAMGEFGRTPRINGRAARDHWPRCYFSMWAGGGVQPGRCIGESDKLAEDPVTSPITPLMVGTTIAELAGIDTQARAEMNVLEGGETIHELL